MAVIPGRLKTPTLPDFEVTGASLKPVGGGFGAENYAFDFAPHAWAGRPYRSDRFAAVPLCWTVEQGYLLETDVFGSLEEYAADRVRLAPTPRLGQAGSLFRLPRAIVLPPLSAFITDTPGLMAVRNLADELTARRVVCLEVSTELQDAPWQILWWSLLHRGFNEVTDFDGPYFTLDVDPEESVGGECLFLETDVSAAPTYVPYRHAGLATNLPNLLAAEQAIAEATAERFAKVRYVHQIAFAEVLTGADLSWFGGLPAQFPDGFLRVHAVEGETSGTTPDPTPAGLLEAAALIEAEIREFFDF